MALLSRLQSRVRGERPATPSTLLPDNFLKDELDTLDRMSEPRRIGYNADGYLHVSSLVAACARREILASQLSEAQLQQVITGGHRLMWEFGRVAERHIRSQVISRRGEYVYGRWECRCGNSDHVGMRPHQDRRCLQCGFPLEVYKEQPVRDEARKIVGNPDLPIMYNGAMVIVEIKSMNKTKWDDLNSPLGDHVLQAALYRDIYARTGWTMHREVVIIYAVKEFKFGSPYKEFHVDCENDTVRNAVATAYAAAEDLATYARLGTRPPRTVCQSAHAPMARECPCATLCFNLS